MPKRLVLVLAVGLLAGLASVWFVQRSQRITQKFVGYLSHEKYNEASRMLSPPSAIEIASDGGVIVVDRAGNAKTVPAERLPFLVSDQEPSGPGDFAMTALQGSENGLLKTPAVTVFFSIENGKVLIESVD